MATLSRCLVYHGNFDKEQMTSRVLLERWDQAFPPLCISIPKYKALNKCLLVLLLRDLSSGPWASKGARMKTDYLLCLILSFSFIILVMCAVCYLKSF